MTSQRNLPPQVHSITGAPTPHSDDLDARVRRYLISMGIRTVCVVLTVVIDNPVRWVFAVGAVLLPYVAVVMANAVGEKRQRLAPVPPVTPAVVISLPGTDSARGETIFVPAPDAERDAAEGASVEQPIKGSHEWTV